MQVLLLFHPKSDTGESLITAIINVSLEKERITWLSPTTLRVSHCSLTWRCRRWSRPSCPAGSGRFPPPALCPRVWQRPPGRCPGWCPPSEAAGQQGLSPASPARWWSGGPCSWRGQTPSPAGCSPHPDQRRHIKEKPSWAEVKNRSAEPDVNNYSSSL